MGSNPKIRAVKIPPTAFVNNGKEMKNISPKEYLQFDDAQVLLKPGYKIGVFHTANSISGYFLKAVFTRYTPYKVINPPTVIKIVNGSSGKIAAPSNIATTGLIYA